MREHSNEIENNECPIQAPIEFIWMFLKIGGTPKSSILEGFSVRKPSILGYPYFWKHPYRSFRPLCIYSRVLLNPGWWFCFDMGGLY